MQAYSRKAYIAACFFGGFLISITGCSRSTPEVEETVVIVQLQPVATVGPTVSIPPTVTPTPRFRRPTPVPEATPTPFVAPLPIPTPPESGPFTYHTVAGGQTLGYIALRYQTDLEQLVLMNELDGPSALIHVDQTLRVPLQTDAVASSKPLVPDSEVVYGAAYADFDVEAFVADQGGYLTTYEEYVDNELLNGAQVVARISEQFSVGPRLLLAILEYYGQWVTNPTPTASQLQAPLGPRNPRGPDLYHALAFTANRVNAGYYGYKRDGFWVFNLADGSQAVSADGMNAGTIGLQNILAVHSDWNSWQQELDGIGLLTTYRELFGDPYDYEVAPVIPFNLSQPPLALPWATGQGFYFTSGPHAGYVDGSAWAAIDFGPPDVLGNCFYSAEPTTAAADGVVVVARQGEIYLDLDGDGNIQTGWVLLYLHAALDLDTPLQVGQHVKQGDVIGYASCEAGLSTSSHIHFARRYNGEWLAAGGPVPMNLSGWVVQENLVPYNGTMVKGNEVREACECWEPDLNLIVNSAAP